MKELKKAIPYLIVIIIAFYLLPNLIKDTGSGILMLLIVIPLTCFLTGLIFGIKNSFEWYFPVLVGLLFIPSIFIYYNESALIYAPVYGVLTLVGEIIGRMLNKYISNPMKFK